MKRIIPVLCALALTLALAAPGVMAQTATSGGQALVPPFHLFYSSNTERIDFAMQLANLSDETIHVRVTYFDRLGAVAKTDEFDIGPSRGLAPRYPRPRLRAPPPWYSTRPWNGQAPSPPASP